MSWIARRARWTLLCVMGMVAATAQQQNDDSQRLVESGKIEVAGQSVSYVIRRLPVNAFPDLPAAMVKQLSQRGCLIPQSYVAHHPENVVGASLERAGSSDWAVLCSAGGEVSLLVFFGSAPGKPEVLATHPEKERLQRHDSSGVLGFNWAIEAARPEQVHEAQSGMTRRPPMPDHDALADITLDRTTIYHFFSKKGKWTKLDTTD